MVNQTRFRSGIVYTIAFMAGFATTLLFIVLVPANWSGLSLAEYQLSLPPQEESTHEELLPVEDFETRSTKAVSIALRNLGYWNPLAKEYWQDLIDRRQISFRAQDHAGGRWSFRFYDAPHWAGSSLIMIVDRDGTAEVRRQY